MLIFYTSITALLFIWILIILGLLSKKIHMLDIHIRDLENNIAEYKKETDYNFSCNENNINGFRNDATVILSSLRACNRYLIKKKYGK